MANLSSMDNKELATKASATVEVDDLLFEIFLRLPVRSIQRFITTCKQWQSLMTLPTFRKLWRKRNLKPATGIFIRYQTYSTYLVPFSPNKPTNRVLTPFKKDFSIIQSCNGLLLCSNSCVYYVYNPTTKKYHTLPQVDGFDVSGGIPVVSLAFDPNKSPHYKVIYFIVNKPRVHVYSSDTRCWKSVSISESYTPCYLSSRGVYWNGAIHWRYWYFDIENEKFKRMPTPTFNYYYFGESCERLIDVNICNREGAGSYRAYVYELKRDYSGWVSKYRAKLDNKYSIISVVYGVEEDDDFLVLKSWNKIVRYNLGYKTYEELDSPIGDYVYDTAFHYIESLCGV